MRIKQVDPELYFAIRSAWMLEERQREDALRTLDQMEENLLKDPTTFWFYGPSEKSFFWVDRINGDTGCFHSVNADGREGFNNRKAAMKIIRDIMGELELRRLEAYVPASAKIHKSLMWHLGFTHEGTLRRRARYDGDWTDVEVYGLLAEELEGKIKKRKRTRTRPAGDTGEAEAPAGEGEQET